MKYSPLLLTSQALSWKWTLGFTFVWIKCPRFGKGIWIQKQDQVIPCFVHISQGRKQDACFDWFIGPEGRQALGLSAVLVDSRMKGQFDFWIPLTCFAFNKKGSKSTNARVWYKVGFTCFLHLCMFKTWLFNSIFLANARHFC
jgi:hypothetical protein